ncbi:MAG: hypothetical protein LLG01_11135 [Planctomycetaceae bacterium]|nr:hypothetical protein [Planctomycetaceae bacterium]
MNALAWLAAGLGGGAVGFPMIMAGGAAARSAGLALGVLAGGAIMGFFQWLVLRTKFPAVRWWAWTLSAFAAAAVVVAWIAAGSLMPHDKTVILTWSPLSGLAAGVFQWLILRRRASRAGWWIALNALAAPAGFGVFCLAFVVSHQPVAAILVGLSCGGGMAGLIHGIALAWIMKPKANA